MRKPKITFHRMKKNKLSLELLEKKGKNEDQTEINNRNETKNCFLEKVSKNDKCLARLRKKR